MPTIRDLVGELRRREGVEAVVLLGRDGLLIDSQSAPQLDAESVAALVPGIVSAADEFGAQSGRGALVTGILEYRDGLAIVSVLTDDAMLLVLVQQTAQLGPLLFELRRNHAHIASLI